MVMVRRISGLISASSFLDTGVEKIAEKAGDVEGNGKWWCIQDRCYCSVIN